MASRITRPPQETNHTFCLAVRYSVVKYSLSELVSSPFVPKHRTIGLHFLIVTNPFCQIWLEAFFNHIIIHSLLHWLTMEGWSSECCQGLKWTFFFFGGGGGLCPPQQWNTRVSSTHLFVLYQMFHPFQKCALVHSCQWIWKHGIGVGRRALAWLSTSGKSSVQKLNKYTLREKSCKMWTWRPPLR